MCWLSTFYVNCVKYQSDIVIKLVDDLIIKRSVFWLARVALA